MVIKDLNSLEIFLSSSLFFISEEIKELISNKFEKKTTIPDSLFPFSKKEVNRLSEIDRYFLAMQLDLQPMTYYKGNIENNLFLIETDNDPIIIDNKTNNSHIIKTIALFGFILEDGRYIPTEYSPNEVKKMTSSSQLNDYLNNIGKQKFIELSEL